MAQEGQGLFGSLLRIGITDHSVKCIQGIRCCHSRCSTLYIYLLSLVTWPE